MSQKLSYLALTGGEDLSAPPLTVSPARASLTHNYELDISGRYRLIDGYEAFDGQTKPSEANYYLLYFTAGRSEILVGDIVANGAGSFGTVIAVSVSSGSWVGGDAAGHLALYKITGAFADGNDLTVSGSTRKATASGMLLIGGAPTDALDITYRFRVIEAARSDIKAVPGSGSVLGVWQYKGVKYAFRNNEGGTAARMYKSSTSGWALCDLGKTVAFTSGGVYVLAEGDTVEGATSGATAIVKRIIITSGTFAGGDAAGTLVLYSQTGTFQAENLDVGANLDVATIGADSVSTTLPAGGKYEFVNHNFGGHVGTRRMYGCNGVGKAFEWDGTVFVPITTGMTADTPSHIIAHKSHLFLLFAGGSVQHSSITNPYAWSAITGAAEFGIGDEGTGFISLPNVLAVFSRNSTRLIYGSSSADWDMRPHSNEAGAIEWTIQNIGSAIYLDDRGLTSLEATDAYGDFKGNALSKDIDPYLKTVMDLVVDSVRVKEKNQYRLFLDGGSAITLTVAGNKVVGFTRQQYGKPISCVCSGENLSGKEEIFFGSTDGFVYQMDKGTSLNGNPLKATIVFHANNLKSPGIKKRVRKIVMEIDAPLYTYLSAKVDFNYGDNENTAQISTPGSAAGAWDVSSWDSFVWDGIGVRSLPLYIDGTGENFTLTINYSGEWELQENETSPRTGIVGAQPHTLQGYLVYYDIRGFQR